MTFLKWALAFWKPYIILVATPGKNYEITLYKGCHSMKTKKPVLRGFKITNIWIDDLDRSPKEGGK